MGHNSRGARTRTRRRLEQPAGYRPTITKFLQELPIGGRVVITPEPSSQRGMPFPRFIGKTGRVVAKRGRSYVIEVADGEMLKQVISRPEHLKLLKT